MMKHEKDEIIVGRSSINSNISEIDITPDYVVYQREKNATFTDNSSPKYEVFEHNYEMSDKFE